MRMPEMDISHRKEQFSLAYVKAVAAVAGFATYSPSVDDDSVDLGIASRGSGGSLQRPRLELQLKCTADARVWADRIPFKLTKKNYDDLTIDRPLVPRILVVVLVPPQPDDWLSQTEKELALRHCGYWLSLRGMPAVPNRTTVTVHIPRRNVFSVDSLRKIMWRIGKGELP